MALAYGSLNFELLGDRLFLILEKLAIASYCLLLRRYSKRSYGTLNKLELNPNFYFIEQITY